MENGNGVTNNDAATLALLQGAVGYGYANNGNFAYDGSVINAKVDAHQAAQSEALANVRQIQTLQLDKLEAQNTASQFFNSEFRQIDRLNGLNTLLFNQFNQIDRRFSDQALAAQECCCELRTGQAAIMAKLNEAEAVRNAVQNAEQSVMLRQLLDNQRGNGNN